MTAFEGELGTKAGMNTQAVLYWTLNSFIKGPNSLFVNLMNESKDLQAYVTGFNDQ